MTQSTAPAVPADRYGVVRSRSRRDRIVGIVVAGLLALALTGWAAWTAWSSAHVPVRWQDGAFTLVDDGHARFGFDVTTDPGRRVVCTVRVFNQGLAEVGRRDVPAGPASAKTFRVTAVVPTTEAAASATVRACALAHTGNG
ncbi:MAG TPA: DUF4307 domain-containing protein [Kineosporiaceae bacterium]